MTAKCLNCPRPATAFRGLCWNCYKDPAVKALYPPLRRGRKHGTRYEGDGRPPKLCKNGCGRAANAARGLCRACYHDPAVRERFPARGRWTGRPQDGRNRKPARKPGEPLHRCLWCMRWRCHGYFQLCPECQGELNRAMVGMPEEPCHPMRESTVFTCAASGASGTKEEPGNGQLPGSRLTAAPLSEGDSILGNPPPSPQA